MSTGLLKAEQGRGLAAGFAEPVFDSQRAFRAAMDALANPGRISPVPAPIAGAPVPAAAAAIVLALCDFETSLYLSPSVVARHGATEYLRFHTDAAMTSDPAAADFAILDLQADPLSLAAFAQGTPEYPDRSTTIVAITASISEGAPLRFSGPGMAKHADLRVAGLPDDFPDQWRANRARFPLGVDLIFASEEGIVGLPRSARLIEGGR